MKFIGRTEELARLKTRYDSNNSEAIMIYGKRRIGKTEMIFESLKDISYKTIYFQCQRTSYLDNIKKINNEISFAFGIPSPDFKEIDEILNFLYKKSESETTIFVLDEYPYLREIKNGIDDIIQSFVDSRKKSKLKLLLCGSYIDVMQEMMSAKSALYNRFSEIIFLKELSFKEACSLCPDSFNDQDKVKTYSVFSGVPYYYSFLEENLSIDENIIKHVLNQNSAIFKEAENTLNSELVKIGLANSVFQEIALGKNNFNELKNSIGIENPNSLNTILKKLMEMELIEKLEPINRKNNKKTYYVITDNFYHFYYRYVFRYQNRLSVLGPSLFYESIKKDFNEQYIPKVFEKISKEFIIAINRKLYFKNLLLEIGKYWYDDKETRTNAEFDVVALTENGDYMFFEAKYKESKIELKDIEHLVDQIKNVDLKSNDIGFISKSGFTDDAIVLINKNNWYAFTLEDIIKS